MAGVDWTETVKHDEEVRRLYTLLVNVNGGMRGEAAGVWSAAYALTTSPNADALLALFHAMDVAEKEACGVPPHSHSLAVGRARRAITATQRAG
jgi:hypothetical protein